MFSENRSPPPFPPLFMEQILYHVLMDPSIFDVNMQGKI
jgi:hypothetical protein